MSRLPVRIAWRYMQSRKGSRLLSLTTTIAIVLWTIGVGALITIIGVMNGMQQDYRDKILVGSADIQVLPHNMDLLMYDWRKVLPIVEGTPGVVSVAPFLQVTAFANAPGIHYRAVAQIVGMVSDTGKAAVTPIRSKITPGGGQFTFDTPGGRTGAVVGRRLAELLGVSAGGTDSIKIVTFNPDRIDPVTGRGLQLLDTTLVVTGIFDTGLFEYDDKYVYVALETAQELMRNDGAITGLEVRTLSRDAAFDVDQALTDTLAFAARVENWGERNAVLFQALKLEKIGMAFILTLVIIVAAFNIVGTLTMVVYDKTREIGILRAMGTTAGAVQRVFFLQGMIIGSIGTAAGVVLGLVMTVLIDKYELIKLPPDVYFIDHLPATTELRDVVLIVLGSMVIAAIATQGPARQAARLSPVDAIRHE
jgi:lipoprotein-releasing system permease protein